MCLVCAFVDVCAPGSYSTTGLSPCTQCPANTYQSSQRSTLYMNCPPGTVAPNGSANCTGKDILPLLIALSFCIIFLYFRGMFKFFFKLLNFKVI